MGEFVINIRNPRWGQANVTHRDAKLEPAPVAKLS